MKERGTPPAPPATKMVEPSHVSSLANKIKKQGTPPKGAIESKVPVGTPGVYEVLHGKICFGHDPETGESIYAYQGAHVELSAEEAGRMLHEGATDHENARPTVRLIEAHPAKVA